jgi:hypothetical protein
VAVDPHLAAAGDIDMGYELRVADVHLGVGPLSRGP